MADIRKAVEIVLKLVDNTKTALDTVTANVTRVNTAVTTLQGNISKSVTSLTGLSSASAPDLSSFTSGLSDLSKVNSKKVSSVIESLRGMSGITVPKGFNGLVENLTKLSQITKFPPLRATANALKLMGEVGAFPNIKTLVKHLNELASITKLPSLASLSKAIKELGKITSIPSLSSLATGLKEISSIGKLPTIKAFVTQLIRLSKLKGFPSLTSLATALAKFSSIGKFPPMTSFIKSLAKLAKMGSFPDAAKLSGVAAALQKFSKIDKFPSLVGIVNGLKALQKLKLPSFQKLVVEINKLAKAFAKLVVSSPIIQAFANINTAATKLNQNLGLLQRQVRSTESAFGRLHQRLSNYMAYRVIADSLFLLQDGFRAGRDSIIEYDQALKDLQAITGASIVEVQQMGSVIKTVASTTKFSASEVAEGMRTLGQSGLDATEAIQTMQAVSDLATGTLSAMTTTVDLMTTAMRVFSIESSNSAHIADVFANAVNKSKLTVDKLRVAFNYIGPIARDAGVSFSESAAAMMTLANSGLRASTIGTGLRRVFAELVNPSKKLRTAIEEAGFAISELDPNTNALSEVIARLGVVVQGSQEAFELFGKRGAAAVLALANSSDNAFDRMLAAANKSGTAAEMAATQMEGLGVSIKNLQDKMKNLAIAFGEAGITKILRVLVDASRAIVDLFTYLAEDSINKVIIQMTLLATSFAIFIGLFNTIRGMGIGLFFVELATNIQRATVGMKAATTAALGLRAGLTFTGIIVGVSLLIYAYKALTTSAKEASDEAIKLSGEFANNLAIVESYRKNVLNLKDGSNELLEANKGLRRELIKVAESNSKLSTSAFIAMQSINALTGEFEDGGEALENYQKIASELSLAELVISFKEGFRSINQEMGWFQNTLDGMMDIPGRYANAWRKASRDSSASILGMGASLLKFAGISMSGLWNKEGDDPLAIKAALKSGELSWEEYTKYIVELNKKLPSELVKSERHLIQMYEDRNADAIRLLNELSKHGISAAHSTTEEMLATAESIAQISEQSEYATQALIHVFNQAKLSIKTVGTDIIKVWEQITPKTEVPQIFADDALDGMDEQVVDAFNKVLEKSNKALVDKNREYKKKAVDHVKELHQQRIDGTIKTDKELERKLYEFNAVNRKAKTEMLGDERYVIAVRLNQELMLYRNRMALLDKNASDYARKAIQYEKEFLNSINKIGKGKSDPEFINSENEQFKTRENEYKLHLSRLERIEDDSKNPARQEAAQAAQAKLTLDHYANELAIAEDHWNKMKGSEELTNVEKKKILGHLRKMRVANEVAQSDAVKVETDVRINEQKREINDRLEVITKGTTAIIAALNGLVPKSIGKTVESVLNNIAEKENKLLETIKKNAKTIEDIHESVAAKRDALNQKSMTVSEKYIDNRRLAEEALAKATMLRMQAENLQGEAKTQKLLEANKQSEKAITLSEKMTLGVSKGSVADAVMEEQLSIIDRAEKGMASSINSMNKAKEAELNVWRDAKEEVLALKVEVDALKDEAAKPITMHIGMSTDKLSEDLGKLQGSIVDSMKAMDIPLNLKDVKNVKKDIKGVEKEVRILGTQWKDIWTEGAEEADEMFNDISERLSVMFPEVEIEFKFTGTSGPTTSSIDDTIDEVQSKINLVADETPILDVDVSRSVTNLSNVNTFLVNTQTFAKESKEQIDKLLDPINEVSKELLKLEKNLIEIIIKYSKQEFRDVHNLVIDWMSLNSKTLILDIKIIGSEVLDSISNKIKAVVDAIPNRKRPYKDELVSKKEETLDNEVPLKEVNPYEQQLTSLDDLMSRSSEWRSVDSYNKNVEKRNTEEVIAKLEKEKKTIEDIIKIKNDDILEPRPIDPNKVTNEKYPTIGYMPAQTKDTVISNAETKDPEVETPPVDPKVEKFIQLGKEYKKYLELRIEGERFLQRESERINLEVINDQKGSIDAKLEKNQIEIDLLDQNIAKAREFNKTREELTKYDDAGVIKGEKDIADMLTRKIALQHENIQVIKEASIASKEASNRELELLLSVNEANSKVGNYSSDQERLDAVYDAHKLTTAQIVANKEDELRILINKGSDYVADQQNKANEILEIQKQANEDELEYARQTAENKLQLAETQWSRSAIAVEDYREAIQVAYDQGLMDWQTYHDKMGLISDSFHTKWKTAWAISSQSVKKTEEYMLDMTARIQTAMVDDLGDALWSVADGTKSLGQAFGAMAKDVLNDLAKMLLKMSLMKMWGLSGVSGFSKGGQIQKKADGGEIKGYSPSSTADNILAWVTAKEFVHPVKAVQHYGLGFMESVRSLRFPKELTSTVNNITNIPSSNRLSSGGIPAPSETTYQAGDVNLKIANIVDREMVGDYLKSDSGEKLILNVMRRNGSFVKALSRS